MDKNELQSNIISGFDSLVTIVDTLAFKVNKGLNILNEKEKLKLLHKFLIEVNCSIEQSLQNTNIEKLSEFYQIKNFLRDIDFCLGHLIVNILINYCKNYPLKNEITYPYISKERRYNYYYMYASFLKRDYNITNNEELILNNSIKYNDTIVMGDSNFHNLIMKMKLPFKSTYYLNEKQISQFFENLPNKLNNKYKICKYFIIINGKSGIEFLETIKYLSSVYGVRLIAIVFIPNSEVKIEKKILEEPLLPTILVYNEKNILNYFSDNLNRMKERNIKYGDNDEIFFRQFSFMKFPKLNEIKIIKEQDNGWDMIRDIDINIFKLVNYERILGYVNLEKFTRDMYKIYKENNCLDLFLNYYGNYFGVEHLIESQCSLVASVKMFLYAYTLEENNGKSLYSIMNNDFRSGNPDKISRYLMIIKSIYDLLKSDGLKSYSGDIYRATYFKKELIDEIKLGKKMMNASLWSSTKKIDVAKKFLFMYKKNILLHAKVKEGNNIDIHLEKLSQFPNEEEVLFLPYCSFIIKRFDKVVENGLEYYYLELVYCDDK